MPITSPSRMTISSSIPGEQASKSVDLLKGPTLDECREAQVSGARLMFEVRFPGNDLETDIPLFVDSLRGHTVQGRTAERGSRYGQAIEVIYDADTPRAIRYLRWLN
jgi:hypothetical protein